MRFDDSVRTVLAIDTSTAFGAEAAWRQLVDLIGRGRAPASADIVDKLREMRGMVPAGVRASSARSLAYAAPGPELVALFADEDPAIAAPVVRAASLPDDAWLALLPRLSAPLRGILRHRRDLTDTVMLALEQFGAIDLVLSFGGETSGTAHAPVVEKTVPAIGPGIAATATPIEQPTPAPALIVPFDVSPFVAVGDVARELPVVAEARRRAEVAPSPSPSPSPSTDIADLVARIDAFTRTRTAPLEALSTGNAPAGRAITPSDRFRFETDVAGVIRWVEGVERGPVIGVSIADARGQPQVDGVATGAFRRRTAFRHARLQIAGTSPAGGSWRISASPLFDPASGRFIGYRGSARRPRQDESAAPRSGVADSLRQLVHELRTPANAIAGFAELIESELLGPAPAAYRERAAAIRLETAGLVAAIDDLDTAARVESGALELRSTSVALAPLIERTVTDLAALAKLRGARLVVAPIAADLAIDGDDRVAERLIGRLLAALVSSAARDETVGVVAIAEPDARLLLTFDRPAALAAIAPDGLLSIDAEREAEAPGAPLLGTGFAIRLAQNLAREMGGALLIEPERLTLRLPAVVPVAMDLAFIH